LLPDNTHIQSVDLKVKNIDESLHFYSDLLGMKTKEISHGESELYSDINKPYLVKLIESLDGKFPTKDKTGLYHTAFRFPNRKELARVFMRLFENKYKFQGFSDHLVSEAIYLADPDGNGVELYTDKPVNEWTWTNGSIDMDSLPLDLSVITKELDDPENWNGISPEADIGHIHLKVSNLMKAQKFYSLMLGFRITTSAYPGALFFAAGNYHHHVGANVWHSRNSSPPPENSLGLDSFTINIPEKDKFADVVNYINDYDMVMEKSEDGSVLLNDFDNIKIRLTL
jgi:catechol 2,3-dioxygenase